MSAPPDYYDDAKANAGYDQPSTPYSPPPPVVYAQPQGGIPPPQVSTTNVVVQMQPQVRVVGKRPWQTSMCSCMDDLETCCLVYWCGPCYLCHLSDKMGEGCCMPWCVPNALMALRIKLRTENRIEGTITNDHLTSCCCAPCALCQLSREFDLVSQQQEVVMS